MEREREREWKQKREREREGKTMTAVQTALDFKRARRVFVLEERSASTPLRSASGCPIRNGSASYPPAQPLKDIRPLK